LQSHNRAQTHAFADIPLLRRASQALNNSETGDFGNPFDDTQAVNFKPTAHAYGWDLLYDCYIV